MELWLEPFLFLLAALATLKYGYLSQFQISGEFLKESSASIACIFLLFTLLTQTKKIYTAETQKKIILVSSLFGYSILLRASFAPILFSLFFLFGCTNYPPNNSLYRKLYARALYLISWLLPIPAYFFLSEWQEFGFALGIYLFVFWLRIILFTQDFNDSEGKQNLSVLDFALFFLHPSNLLLFGQGGFLALTTDANQNKKETLFPAYKLIGLSLLYIFLALPLLDQLHHAWNAVMPWKIHASIQQMLLAYQEGAQPRFQELFLTTILEQLRYFLIFAGISHMKIGAWNATGADYAPQFNAPFLSTNLSEIWQRHSWHYRILLQRSFYLPIFLSTQKLPILLRRILAILFSAFIGNLLIHCALFGLPKLGENWGMYLNTWPYFLLLAFGICVQELWSNSNPLPKLRRSPPYLACAWLLTWSFFCLIHLFSRPVAALSPVDILHMLLDSL